MSTEAVAGVEQQRLHEADLTGAGWRRWGPYRRNPVTFSEYFHGHSGAGLGAAQQTRWTALVAGPTSEDVLDLGLGGSQRWRTREERP
jgi:hypothetical protein